MTQPLELRSQLKKDKFYPPQVDSPQFLYRERVVNYLLNQNGSRTPTIILEAQAGQGKSTLIKQYLDRIETASVWYQVSSEDADPAFFLKAFSACINDFLPEFPSAGTAQIFATKDFEIFDPWKWIDLLLNDLHRCLKDDLYIVFDDLHYLLPHEASRLVLQKLFEAAPPNLHFIFSSRESLPLDNWRTAISKKNVIRLGNRDLALDENEVTDFFHQVHHLAVPSDTIREITRTTDGWIMGILLLELQMEKQHVASFISNLFEKQGFNSRDLLQYFRREVFTPLEPRLHRPLLMLSLLEEVPVALAKELTGESEIGADLGELARRNIFIRALDPNNGVFGFHHLFRQFLQEKAETELSSEIIREIFRQAGRFCLGRENPTQALRYLLQAGDYDAIEAVLKDTGMSFLETNQTATLSSILEQIPEPCLNQLGWSPFFLALANLDSAPVKALPLLDKALAVFSARRESVGELLSLSHIISIRIITTGHYREGEALLVRAEQLFFQTAEILDVSTTILVARSLAMGHCIFLGDVEQAGKFANLALALAREKNLVNFEAALLMVMGYIQIFGGLTTSVRMYLEEAAPFVHHPEVGTFNSLSIRMMLFNFLFHDGDFYNYFDQKNQLVETIGSTLFSQSIAGPFCHVWELDIAINQGCYEKALDIAKQVLALEPPLSPHLRSQVLQLQAVVLSLRGEQKQALAATEESQRLRELSGGLYFITLNKLLVGLCHCRCGKGDQGLELLSQGIEDAREMPTEYLEVCGLLHRGGVHLAAGPDDLAREDIKIGLMLMRRNAYRHFWAWDPESMEKVLTFAVVNNIESDYARALAMERLSVSLLDDGTAIPLLDIQTFGGFKILQGHTLLLRGEDLTPLQRELLYLILSTPELKMSQETIQLYFWPDSPSDAVKMKFDALVSRLRKILADVLPKNMAHFYFKREKGMLWLAHCRVDALDFLDGVRNGLKHLKMQKTWQAANAFTLAESLWQGEFALEVTGEDRIRAFREELVSAYSEMALAWCDLLVRAQRLPKAIHVAETALRYDPFNDRLYGLLYQLQGRTSALQARQVLKRFSSFLQAEGYSGDEITELVAGIAIDQTTR